jgi:hypothetical protein
MEDGGGLPEHLLKCELTTSIHIFNLFFIYFHLIQSEHLFQPYFQKDKYVQFLWKNCSTSRWLCMYKKVDIFGREDIVKCKCNQRNKLWKLFLTTLKFEGCRTHNRYKTKKFNRYRIESKINDCFLPIFQNLFWIFKNIFVYWRYCSFNFTLKMKILPLLKIFKLPSFPL